MIPSTTVMLVTAAGPKFNPGVAVGTLVTEPFECMAYSKLPSLAFRKNVKLFAEGLGILAKVPDPMLKSPGVCDMVMIF